MTVTAACGSDSDEDGSAETTTAPTPSYVVTMPPMLEVEGAPFVAATSWSAAFVRAAGADTVSVLVPAGSPDPFGYVADEAELAPVAAADFVVVDGREAVVGVITDALPTEGEIITFTLDNDPEHVKSWVLGLGERFMLGTTAQDWADAFDEALVGWEAQLDEARPLPTPTALVDESLVTWATLGGVEVVGTFDGATVTADEAAALAGLDADLVLIAEETPPPADIDLGDADVVTLTNFPDESLDLMGLFEDNVETLVDAFGI
jgi:zinc transport system substrate-binding protein